MGLNPLGGSPGVTDPKAGDVPAGRGAAASSLDRPGILISTSKHIQAPSCSARRGSSPRKLPLAPSVPHSPGSCGSRGLEEPQTQKRSRDRVGECHIRIPEPLPSGWGWMSNPGSCLQHQLSQLCFPPVGLSVHGCQRGTDISHCRDQIAGGIKTLPGGSAAPSPLEGKGSPGCRAGPPSRGHCPLG